MKKHAVYALILSAALCLSGCMNKSGIEWENSDGNLTLTGSSDIKYTVGEWSELGDELCTVTIEDGITGIGDYAFENFGKLEKVVIPDSVTYIGEGAFKNCKSLKEITVPAGVETIAKDAFEGCIALERVVIVNENVKIEDGAFPGSLKIVTNPDTSDDTADITEAVEEVHTTAPETTEAEPDTTEAAPETTAPETTEQSAETTKPFIPTIIPTKENVAKEINEAIEKMAEFDSMHLSITATMKMDMSVSGMTMDFDIPMDIDIKFNIPEEKYDITMKMVLPELLGGTMEMRSYTEGEWQYVVENGTSYKTKAAIGGFEDIGASWSVSLPSTAFIGKSFVYNADGSKSVTVNIPGELVKSLIPAETLDGLLSGEDITMDDAAVTVTIKDGLLKKYDIVMNMALVSEGIPFNLTIDCSSVYNVDEQPIVITPPAGYESFEEIAFDDSFSLSEVAAPSL